MCIWRWLRPYQGGALGLLLGALCVSVALAETTTSIDVTTHHYDSMRTGWNSKEIQLSPNTIKNGSFGLLKTITLDEQIDAQPLIVSNLDFAGQSHQVVFVVSENNTIYAIDTSSGSILQQRNLGPSVSAGANGIITCGNNSSEIGVTSTPVIDRDNNSLYLVTFTLENNQPAYRIHALDLVTLADKVLPPVVTATAALSEGSPYQFNAKVSRQRAALALSNDKKTVYGAFASFCDQPSKISRGWIMGWDAKTLSSIATEVTDHRASTANNYYLTSIWMSGSGPAIDANGNVYFITGNSRPDSATSPPAIDPNKTMRESVVKMRGDLASASDFFTPMDVALLETQDNDFGSGGVMLIPDHEGSSVHLVIAAGKKGDMFLLDRENLGKFDPTKNHVLDTQTISRCWCAQSYFVGDDGVGRVISSGGTTLSSWKVQTAPSPSLVKEWENSASLGSNVFQKGFFTTISSDGVKPGTAVVWAVERPHVAPPMLTLWAFNATSGAKIAAVSAGNWPNTGGAANTVPVVANGKVFVASNRALMIFGLGAQASASAGLVAITSATNARAPAREAVLYGTVVQVDGSTLWLRTRTDMARIDVSDAENSGKTVTIVPGGAVEVVGQLQSDGIVRADWIGYAPDSPALWKADE